MWCMYTKVQSQGECSVIDQCDSRTKSLVNCSMSDRREGLKFDACKLQCGCIPIAELPAVSLARARARNPSKCLARVTNLVKDVQTCLFMYVPHTPHISSAHRDHHTPLHTMRCFASNIKRHSYEARWRQRCVLSLQGCFPYPRAEWSPTEGALESQTPSRWR